MRLPHVDVTRARGKEFFYYRPVRGGPRIKLPGKPGEPEFHRAYERMQLAPKGKPKAPEKVPPAEHSLAALIAAYRSSTAWASKAPGTRKDYEKALRPLEENFGHLHVPTLPRPFVFSLREQYSQKAGAEPGAPPVLTPRRGNGMVAVLSILFSLAVNLGWRTDNPALRPGKQKTGPGWRSWTDEELDTFLAAEGTPASLRLAVLLAACTGQRGQDLVAMTWEKFDGTAIQVRQIKTDALVWIPLHARARVAVMAAPRTAATILTRDDGKSWGLDHFRHEMTAAIKGAGLVGVVTHGLRATAGRWMAEAGCSEREIMSITGHTTSNMVSKYVREASQKTQATSAMAKVELHQKNTEKTKCPKQGTGDVPNIPEATHK